MALHEKTRVLRAVQQYGETNTFFLNLTLDTLFAEWFQGIIMNSIPVRTHSEIQKNLRRADKLFVLHFAKAFKKYILGNNMSGLRQFLGDGIIYRLIKR